MVGRKRFPDFHWETSVRKQRSSEGRGQKYLHTQRKILEFINPDTSIFSMGWLICLFFRII